MSSNIHICRSCSWPLKNYLFFNRKCMKCQFCHCKCLSKNHNCQNILPKFVQKCCSKICTCHLLPYFLSLKLFTVIAISSLLFFFPKFFLLSTIWKHYREKWMKRQHANTHSSSEKQYASWRNGDEEILVTNSKLA